MLDFKAEKAKIAQDKLTKVKERISVKPRKQPPREAVAAAAAAAAAAATAAAEEEERELDIVHSDSEDIDSDISNDSTDSYGLDEVYKSIGSFCTDSEYQELSGVDREEFNERHKKKRKFLRKPRENPLPLLQRLHSTDRYSQECIIKVREPEGTVPPGVGEGVGRRGVVGLVEGFSNIVLPVENASIDHYAK